ncbi:MAG: transglycosylase SLT domain-containing protein [Bacteroidales bacterium]|nr:transglycosylase SLT domain-containing protein [Bacteroidales bacterium]
MKLKLAALVALVISAVQAPVAQAQEVHPSGDAELMTLRYAESYDSLLNSYYLRRNAHRHLRSARELSLEEFDALPDSVIIRRLQALHTVIPMTYNAEVRSHIRFYLKVMANKLDVMLTLCEYYHPMFEEALSRYGVPEELKYLSIVESAMNPQATSRVGAAGLWQFMYSTGKLYDLEVNSVVDERRDPYKSTVAAARHLSDLYRVFGDWQLAIAAYNCGSGNINKAIARSGGKRGFWDIYYNLPRETRGYIPSFIAVIYVMNYYEEHGLRPGRINLPLRSDTIMLDRDVFLQFVAEETGMEMDELRTLNPQYRVDFIPGSSGMYPICLPTSRLEPFINNQDSIYARTADSLSRRPVKVEPRGKSVHSKASGSKYYTVRKGDTLGKIASKHGISVSTLKKRNGLRSDKIRVGQKLKVK